MRRLRILSAVALLLPVLFAVDFDEAYGWSGTGKLSWERRYGSEVDDWQVEGPAVVTSSPVFDRGLRIAAMGLETETRRVFALASAIFYFEVPEGARELKVKVRYEGEGSDGSAGYLWVRDARYEVKEDGPLYGVTLALRADRSSEVLYLADPGRYINPDGVVEIHLVAEGDQQIDVNYIEVESYSRPRSRVCVVERYEPIVVEHWPRYVYHYYYCGPVYFVDVEPFHYVVYTGWADPLSPIYVELRARFVSYVRVHPIRRVYCFHRWPGRYYYRVSLSFFWPSVEIYEVRHVPSWTRAHARIRTEYLVARRNPKIYEVRVRKPLDSITVSGVRRVKSFRDIRVDGSTAVRAGKGAKVTPSYRAEAIRAVGRRSLRSDGGAATAALRRGGPAGRTAYPRAVPAHRKKLPKDVRSSVASVKLLRKRRAKVDSVSGTSVGRLKSKSRSPVTILRKTGLSRREVRESAKGSKHDALRSKVRRVKKSRMQ